MSCIRKGVLKDMIACKEYEKQKVDADDKIETYYSN